IVLFDGPSASPLTRMKLGRTIEERFGAPYLSLHRADLQAGLLAALQACGSVDAKDRSGVAGVDASADGVVASLADGTAIQGSCLIAADGLWSDLRALVAPGARLRFAGATAWRGMLRRDAASPPFDGPNVGLWLGPRSHLVHYPVRGGDTVNIVVVI